ncbi:hypothetical protein [Brunnivagina elsteri]|uniref:Type II secretion system protein GspC N-terminal domain-containing protein n=1 Tax=Brunnivagina elsteri CCALA 953 TaxID=987040 RepID=A0A2A2TF35_9CYAN|nr:hypothetical protein [Calothrix elsteri]PAX52407.1 hypothetical protein CK510_19475 [Calothrix elsteri CCALA 953]
MPTEASTQILLSEPSEDLIVSEPWSIDAYADGLMDELFADVDRILERRGNIPVQTIEPEFVRMQSVKMPTLGFSETDILPTQTTSKVNQVKKQQISPVVTEKSLPKTVIKQRRKPRRWLSKLLGLGATVGIAAASIIFVQNSGLLNRLVSKSFQQSLLTNQLDAATDIATKTDAQTELGKLVDYTIGAFDAIDRQTAKINRQSLNTAYNTAAVPNQRQLVMASASGLGTLPPPMAANNTLPAQGRSTTVVERIYIPVYQAPLPMRYAPPAIPGVRGTLPPIPGRNALLGGNRAKVLPVKTVSNNVRNVTRPLNLFAAVRPSIPSLKAISLQNQPITLSQPKAPTLKAPTITIAPFRAVPPRMPTATVQKQQQFAPPAQVVAVAPTSPAQILEGLLEHEDKSKSAALFKINGVTRRIEIGEGIGASGWALVEVANGEAVVRRNGEVRSVYAGQSF